MDIREKLNLDYKGLIEHGPITIVAFGDSVTHGAFGHGVFDYDAVYHRVLARKISSLRTYVPVNVINAGIGGTNAKQSLERMDEQVLSHNPDLVTVCFGLNDVNGSLEGFIDSLREIFRRLKERNIETVFMTPNMLNTYVVDPTPENLTSYAAKTAEMQNSGKMDAFMDAARELCRECGVKVADAYAVWREMSKTEDTTKLLANDINHPNREMHELFADILLKTIFESTDGVSSKTESAMYRGK